MTGTGSGRSAATPGLPQFQRLRARLLEARIPESFAPPGYDQLRRSLWVRLLGPHKTVPKLSELESAVEELCDLVRTAAFAADYSPASDEAEALRAAIRSLDAACIEARRVLAA